MTVLELFHKYYNDYAKFRCKSHEWLGKNFHRYFKQIKDRKADSLTPYDVQVWHNQLGAEKGEPTANRQLGLLRTIFNFGERWALIDCKNPAKAVKKFKEESRDRCVRETEMPRLLKAIEQHSTPMTEDLFLMCLYTAQRLQNVCAMRWDDIDFDRGVWRIAKEDFKTGRTHEVPLIEEALQILNKRYTPNGGKFVFPGRASRRMSHISYPYNGWRKVLKAAGITNLTPHDLRRTHATYQSELGTTLPIIAKTLGHNGFQSTAVYARPQTAIVRGAMQQAVAKMCYPS